MPSPRPDTRAPRVNLNAERIQKLIDTGKFRSSAHLAGKAGVTHTTLSRALRGETEPSAPTIAGLVRATGLPYDQIVVTK